MMSEAMLIGVQNACEISEIIETTVKVRPWMSDYIPLFYVKVQWDLSVTTTSMIISTACELFSIVFN